MVLFLSSRTQLQRLVRADNFATWDRHLLRPQTVLLVFYPVGEPALNLRPLKMTDCAARVDGCERWRTARSNTVLLCKTSVDVPLLYGGDMTGARRTQLRTFCGEGHSGEYTVSTKWYTLPMLRPT